MLYLGFNFFPVFFFWLKSSFFVVHVCGANVLLFALENFPLKLSSMFLY